MLLRYLFFHGEGPPSVAVASPEWIEDAKGDELEDQIQPVELVVWARADGKHPLSEAQQKYMDAIRAAKQ